MSVQSYSLLGRENFSIFMDYFFNFFSSFMRIINFDQILIALLFKILRFKAKGVYIKYLCVEIHLHTYFSVDIFILNCRKIGFDTLYY